MTILFLSSSRHHDCWIDDGPWDDDVRLVLFTYFVREPGPNLANSLLYRDFGDPTEAVPGFSAVENCGRHVRLASFHADDIGDDAEFGAHHVDQIVDANPNTTPRVEYTLFLRKHGQIEEPCDIPNMNKVSHRISLSPQSKGLVLEHLCSEHGDDTLFSVRVLPWTVGIGDAQRNVVEPMEDAI